MYADDCSSNSSLNCNLTSSVPLEVGDVPLLPVSARAALITLYMTVVLVSVGGNSLVIAVIAAERRMRTVTNWFILNLACADSLMATVCVPFTFIADVLLESWPFGRPLCPVVGYAQAVAVFLNAFTLVAISVDRHRAIQHPLRPRLSGRQLSAAFGVIWTAALVLPLPVAVLSRVVALPADDGTLDYCKEQWPSVRWRYWYTLTIMLAQYFLPLGVMSVTYSSVAYVVWFKRQIPGEPVGQRDHKINTSKKKVRR